MTIVIFESEVSDFSREYIMLSPIFTDNNLQLYGKILFIRSFSLQIFVSEY